MLGLRNMSEPEIETDLLLRAHSSNGLPASVNWVQEGKVSGVKDQKQCGSCWAFSTTGSLESAYAIAKGTKATELFSEQQLVDCSWKYKNLGCNGGWYYYAWNYLQDFPDLPLRCHHWRRLWTKH